MSYYVSGQAIVERKTPVSEEESEEGGDIEVFEIHGVASLLCIDPRDELNYIFRECKDDVPKEPGVYSVMYVAKMWGVRDVYTGEHDIDYEILHVVVTRYNDEEAKIIIERVEATGDSHGQ